MRVLASILLISASACSPPIAPATQGNPSIYGKWMLVSESNPGGDAAFSYITKGEPASERLKLEVERRNQILMHYGDFIHENWDNYDRNDVVESCGITRIVWKPSVNAEFRDMSIRCFSYVKIETNGWNFGILDNSGVIKESNSPIFNVRLYGPVFDRLRLIDQNGVALYFKRVS